MPGDGSFLGRGWAFPPAFTAGGGDVEVVAGADDVQQSLEILFTTAPGERVMQDTFGTDLSRVMFEELDQGLANTIERLIKNAIVEHEPRIKLDRVDVENHPDEPYALRIHVQYTVRGTNSRFNLVFPFYRMEAIRPGA
ncbi:MAG TPA: GPW/gp25 family protein [Kofleriaceae bacterium]